MTKVTPASVIEVAVKVANVGCNTNFVDLGSRDGRVVQLACLMSGCNATGIELDKTFVDKANKFTEQRFPRLKEKICFLNEDFLKSNLSKFDVIFVFQSGGLLKQLSKKLKREAGHAKIVCWRYPLFKNKPDTVVELERGWKLYFYNMEGN